MQKVTVTGRVCRMTVNRGSKSEHEAVVIELPGADAPLYLPLRLKGDNPFSSKSFDPFVDSRVTVKAVLYNNVLFVDKLADVTPVSILPGAPGAPKP